MHLKSAFAALLIATSVSCLPAMCAATTAPVAVDPVRKAVEDANKLYAAGKYDQAAKVYSDTISMTAKAVGPLAELNRAMLYSNLGTIYFAQKKFADAEKAYNQAIDIHREMLKQHASVVADTLQHYAALLRRTNRSPEADKWQTQADFLLSGNIGPKSRFIDPEAFASVAPDTTGPALRSAATATPAAAPATPTGQAASVVNIVQMTPQDRALLDNPTTMEKPVYRSEEYFEGGYDVFGRAIGERKTRQVLDHYETVPIADSKAGLSYPSSVAELERKYNLSHSSVKTLIDSINSGGSAVELGNGWLLVVDETVDPNVWHSGTSLTVAKSPEGSWALTTSDGRSVIHGNRVATRL